MNAKDRKQASEFISSLEDLKSQIETLAESEQEKFDNMSESLQATERGEAIQLAAENLANAAENLQEAIDNISEAVA